MVLDPDDFMDQVMNDDLSVPSEEVCIIPRFDPKNMDELERAIKQIIPNAIIDTDPGGEIVIYTGLCEDNDVNGGIMPC